MARETVNEDIGIEMEDADESGESGDKKKRTGLTANSFYEALKALGQANARLGGQGDTSPPIVLIAEVDGRFQVHLAGEASLDSIIHDTAAIGTGDDVDEAFAVLIENIQKVVEDKRKSRFSDIDELMKKGSAILRRVKSKKRDGG